MQSPLRKIFLVFILIAMLPVIFLVYELAELNKNESIVRETYSNQLDAILYSVNQYSDDVISNWANRIRQARREGPEQDFESQLTAIVNQVSVVRYVYLSDLEGRSVAHKLFETDPPSEEVKAKLDAMILSNFDQCRRLNEYAEAGFRKMQALETPVYGESIPILFALDGNEGDYQIGVLVVDLPMLIKNNLAPKMQAISQGKLVISAFRLADDSLIYSTEPNRLDAEARADAQQFKDLMHKKDFWILPGYYVGINVVGVTLEDLVRERTKTAIIILGVLALIFAGGIYFLYSNIKREIYLSQAKSEFVSNVSHEIRTPLSLIGMFAETLETGRVTTEEKKKEYYGIISKETARLSRIVNRILNFSQLEANKKTFNFQPVYINDLSADILKMYFYPMQEKGYTFEFNPDEKVLPVRGDKESISEVVVNLLDNAIKYSRDNKHITITTGVKDRYSFIAVKDQGIGIAKNHQRDIFDQFYRAPTGDVHTTKGSGLGLTLVKKIVEAHNGEIKVESIPDKGSTFIVYLPFINTGT
ncbi:MAG TPA: HAMP domain-containing sensor histidine kinase [Cyclobacteriaceae bacterium]|nr:HAMP domain-containing sensor histidine kinase [Cyclobacteriaceae bacterium]